MSEYVYPASIAEAVECLERRAGEGRVIAGGTDLLPDLRKGRIAPGCLVDITRIPSLQQIDVEGDVVTVGAAVTFATLRKHRFLTQHVHALVDAAASVGAGAIQSVATWAGNIVQAMPAADGAIIAVALDAEAEIISRVGARWEPVESLFEGPGCSTIDPTSEIITRLRFSGPWARTGTAWRRVGRRAALVLPILSCAVRVEVEPGSAEGRSSSGDERIASVAIALGPVAPRPVRAREAEAFLLGQSPLPEIVARAGDIARGEANPRTSVTRASAEYRLDILPTLVRGTLAEAVERARYRV
jgi:carbon-monoxide dehydrogenase medium subunit